MVFQAPMRVGIPTRIANKIPTGLVRSTPYTIKTMAYAKISAQAMKMVQRLDVKRSIVQFLA